MTGELGVGPDEVADLRPVGGDRVLHRIGHLFGLITNIGPAAASTNLVLANIHVKVGDNYDPKIVFEDIPNLYATGLFANIQITDRRTGDGVELTYTMPGKPRVTAINFDGNTKFSNFKLMKKVTSKVNAPLDELTLLKDTQAIEKLYDVERIVARYRQRGQRLRHAGAVGQAQRHRAHLPRTNRESLWPW